jgi:hypothetical protein
MHFGAGITVSPDGKRLYLALNLSNRLEELDAATGEVLHLWEVGVEPFGVVLAGHKVYVSNWGGRRPGPESMVGPAPTLWSSQLVPWARLVSGCCHRAVKNQPL